MSGKESAVIDMQFTPALAHQALDSFSLQPDTSLKYAIATHPNPDKFNGASVAQARGALFVASTATATAMPGVHAYKKNFFVNIAKMFQEKDYPAVSKPDLTFEKSKTLKVGNAVLELRELNQSGVSTNQTIVYIPSAKALFVGDLVHHKAHAWLEGGIVGGKPKPTIDSWIAILKDLKSQFPKDTTVYGGRGEPGTLTAVVDDQIEYLQNADLEVQNYVQSLGSKKSELLSSEAGKHFEAISHRFEKKWPTYQFPYLIQYGVYGLVQSQK